MSYVDHIPEWGCLPCPLLASSELNANNADSIILVTESLEKLPSHLESLKAPLLQQKAVDASVGDDVTVVGVVLPARRLIYSPTGALGRDYDDARRFADAAEKGVKRALSAGSKSPMLITLPSSGDQYKLCELVALLGALHALYTPLEVREHARDKLKDSSKQAKANQLLVYGSDLTHTNHVISRARALEEGRFVARDIGGSDPERMAPACVVSYVQRVLADSCVQVKVEDDDGAKKPFLDRYPLLAAVNRAAHVTPRHRGRVIHLEYEGQAPIAHTYMLVGKGITYDTGGLDIKANGVMAGMHRDKCGAAAVAGFFKMLSILKPAGVRVVGAMCMVRNSVDADGYVADEIITSRAGARVRVGNTDAEGRMAMADVLCLMKERALSGAVDPHLFTVATLTGHAVIACGDGYTSALDNGPAQGTGFALRLASDGDLIGDPVEVNTIRREDYEFHKGKSEYEDILQCNNNPSSRTPRGHQTPAAFLIMASGLDKHGRDSSSPLKYTHLDIAASSGPFPGLPTGSPIMALAVRFFGSQFV